MIELHYLSYEELESLSPLFKDVNRSIAKPNFYAKPSTVLSSNLLASYQRVVFAAMLFLRAGMEERLANSSLDLVHIHLEPSTSSGALWVDDGIFEFWILYTKFSYSELGLPPGIFRHSEDINLSFEWPKTWFSETELSEIEKAILSDGLSVATQQRAIGVAAGDG
ncbi:MAG: hypothetical protein ACRYHQ_22340 [Janthinobacterium lividum]